jgi:hypothetical protein
MDRGFLWATGRDAGAESARNPLVLWQYCSRSGPCVVVPARKRAETGGGAAPNGGGLRPEVSDFFTALAAKPVDRRRQTPFLLYNQDKCKIAPFRRDSCFQPCECCVVGRQVANIWSMLVSMGKQSRNGQG